MFARAAAVWRALVTAWRGEAAANPTPPAAAEEEAARPEGLLLRVYVSHPSTKEYRLYAATFTLAQLTDESYVPTLDAFEARVSLADSETMRPETLPLLRDVLLCRNELPGFGLLPAASVPEPLRRRALLQQLICASPDAVAMARVLRAQQSAADDTVWCFANRRLAEMLECATTAGAKWTDADCDAAHEVAQLALQASRAVDVRADALRMLRLVATRGIAQPRFLSLLPHVAAVLHDASSAAVHEKENAMFWMLHALRREDVHGQTAVIGRALHTYGVVPLLARFAALQLNLLAGGFDMACLIKTGPWTSVCYALEMLSWQSVLVPDDLTADWSASVCESALHAALEVTARLVAASYVSFGGSRCVLAVALRVARLALCIMMRRSNEHAPQQLLAVIDLLDTFDAPKLVVKLARQFPENVEMQFVFVAVWNIILTDPSLWPGGVGMLFALALQLDVLRVVLEAQLVLHDTGDSLPIAFAADAKQLMHKILCLAAAAAANDAAIAAMQLRAEKAAACSTGPKNANAAKAEKAARRVADQRSRAEPDAAAAAAADAAAAALLAEEEAAAQKKADAQKKAAAKARKAERKAAERRARAEAEAAAVAAQQAEEEERATLAAAAAAEAAAAEQAQRRAAAQAVERAAAEAEAQRRSAAQAKRTVDAQRRQQQQAAHALAAASRPPQHAAPPRASGVQLTVPFQQLNLGTPAAAAGSAQPADDGDDGSCVICMDRPRTAALQPCDHGLLCITCAAAVLATAVPACPVCRVAATGLRKL